MDFTLNRTWPTFYDYIPVYNVSIQYTNPFKRYRTETKSVTYGADGRTDGTDVRTDSGDTICPPPPPIENGGGIKNTSTLDCLTFSYQFDSNQLINNDFGLNNMLNLMVFHSFRG